MLDTRSVTIYALLDEAGVIRYIGKSVCPEARFSVQKSRRKWVRAWITLEVVTFDRWQDRERYWIAFYRQTHDLENIAPGGGASETQSEAANRKRSASLTGRKQSPEAIKRWLESRRAGKGWNYSQEVRAKMGAANRGKPLLESTRKKMSEVHSRPEVKAKQANAIRGREHSPEHIAKIKAAIEKRRAAGLLKHSPQTIERLRQIRLANPIKAWLGKQLPSSVRENMKRGWIKRKQREELHQ